MWMQPVFYGHVDGCLTGTKHNERSSVGEPVSDRRRLEGLTQFRRTHVLVRLQTAE